MTGAPKPAPDRDSRCEPILAATTMMSTLGQDIATICDTIQTQSEALQNDPIDRGVAQECIRLASLAGCIYQRLFDTKQQAHQLRRKPTPRRLRLAAVVDSMSNALMVTLYETAALLRPGDSNPLGEPKHDIASN